MIKKIFACLFFVTGIVSWCHAQPEKDRWVDSVLSTMNATDKINQIMILRASLNDEASLHDAASKIKNASIGGILLEGGTPLQFAAVVNQLQGMSDFPLLICIRADYSLRLDSTTQYPSSLALGAIHNDTLLYLFGKEIGREMKLIGAHINVSPLADLYEKEDTLLRSVTFGENTTRVASKAQSYWKGLQSEHRIGWVTGFPINAITVSSVDKGLPVVEVGVDSTRMYPFRKLMDQGLQIITPPITLNVPLFYPNVALAKKNKFNSNILSALYSGDPIKKSQQYNGLVFAEIPANRYKFPAKFKSGEMEMYGFMAGNNMLVGSRDLGPAQRRIKKLLRQEPAMETLLDADVRKILGLKYDAGLWNKPVVQTDNLMERFNSPASVTVSKELHQAAITVARDVEKTLPFRTLENKNFAYLSDNTSSDSQSFLHYLSRYVHFSSFVIGDRADLNSLAQSLADQNVIIISVYPETSAEIIERLKRLVPLLSPAHQIVVCDFGNEGFLRSADYFPSIITAYHKTPEVLKVIPEIIFGAVQADGRIPFTASSQVPEGAGLATPLLKRLSYGIPEDAHMDSRVLQKVDDIAKEAIRIGATPGCQILIAKDGKVVYQKNFGFLTYDSTQRVSDETIYDLASLTKVTATLQTVMFMQEKGIIDVNKKLSYYLPELKSTNKKDLTLVDLLTHQAGLVPFVPLWPQTMKDTVFLPSFYSRQKSTEYPLQVAPNLFASPVIRDSVWTWIIHSKMQDKVPRTPYTYRYSDLGFMMMQFLAERMLNQPMQDFLKQNFYEPLGAYTMGYTPLAQFPSQQIAPTEDDRIYRRTRVIGTVHDERAAMMGGIAGHAGMFSDAGDLAKLGQMLLQEGYYGGYQYYKPETVRMFTHKQFEKSRRGLGWDKPIQSDPSSPTSLYASPHTFGHTGFTGTCMWIDPEFNLVYIFLSNRVFPDRNNKLGNSNIRSRIQDVIYQSIFSYCSYSP